MLRCHYQMRNYSYFLLKLSCCNSSDSENSSDCSEYFGSYWTPLSKVKKKIKLQQLFVLKGFTACSSLLRRMGAPTACNRLTSTSLICNVLDYWPLSFCEGAMNRHAKAIKKNTISCVMWMQDDFQAYPEASVQPLSLLGSVFFPFSSSAESLKAFFRGQVALNELSVRQHLAMTNTTELLVAGEKKPYSYVYQGSAWQTSVLASLSIFCLSNIQSCLLAPEEHSESKAACTQTDSKGKAEEAANR